MGCAHGFGAAHLLQWGEFRKACVTMLVDVLLLIATLPVLLATGYLFLLTLCSGRLPVPPPVPARLKFAMIVPAHNESAVIERTVRSLLAVDWPPSLRRAIVVADNCSDDTAALARAAGAEVLERTSDTERGKGFALAFAYKALIGEGWADAVVVIDADTEVTPNLLQAFASRIETGTQAMQAYSGVLNPQVNWRTRLVTIAMTLMHRVRSRGRERLRVSSGVRGNGMCFVLPLLTQVPHRAFSIVEDLEYSVQLGYAGVSVACVDEAEVLAEMVSSNKAAESQRQRWEGGRAQMLHDHGWPLLKASIARRDKLLFEMALDILTPPLATIALAALGLLLLALLLWALGLSTPIGVLPATLCVFFLVAHVLRGVALSGLGWRGWAELARAPFFVLWKLSVKLRRKSGGQGWVRTQREGAPPESRK
jgi:cellulose synthase/poly-beta-1,6-N-acetylglucosamine synthase-like glycosyltransferase